jgi:hypothetical protein
MDLIPLINESLSDGYKAVIGIVLKALAEKEINQFVNFTKRQGDNLVEALKIIAEKPKIQNMKNEELVEKIEAIEQEIFQPILEDILIGHKDEIIRQKWINLLESAILGSSIHPRYIETLRLLDGIDANVLEIIDNIRRTNRLSNSVIQVGLLQRQIENPTEEMVKDSLLNLVERGLCDVNTLQGKPRYSDMDGQNIYISHFGRKFLDMVGEKSLD